MSFCNFGPEIAFMLKQYSFSFFLIVLLASVQSAFAQEFQEPKSRQVMVKESIANLDSNDIKVAAQAAIHLGMYRAIEAVPKLLQVLQSSRLLQKTEHIIEGNLSSYVSIDVRREIVASLRSEEHTSELQSRLHLVCRLLLEKK